MNKVFGFDIEAVPLRLFDPEAKLLCASIAQEFNVSYVKDHYQSDKINKEVNTASLAVISAVLKDRECILSGHNISFDVIGWERFYREQSKGCNIKAQLFDTMVAHSLVGKEDVLTNKLDFVANKYLGHSKLDINPKEIPTSPIDKLILYNNVDSILTYQLYEPLMNEIVDNNLETLFDYLMKVLKVLIKTSIRGVNLDLEYIKTHRKKVQKEIEKYETLLTFAFGNINFNSTQQLSKVLYEDFKLPILEWTKTGNPSTGVDALIKLKQSEEVHELQKNDIQCLLDYRKLKKIDGTYLKALLEQHTGYDGRVHAQYFLGKGYDQGINFGTITGRTSSSNPNLQNQPNTFTLGKDDFTVNIRKSFIPTKGYRLYKADYSQLEMRVGAYLSKDPTMLDVFRRGIDIHTYSLAMIDGEDYDLIMKKLEEGDKHWKFRRRLIKTFNFALIYGASPWKLQMILLKELELDIPIEEIRAIIRQWNRTYNKFTEWRYGVHELIRQLGYVRSETGRIRYFFKEGEDYKYDRKTMAKFYREGLNDIVQSFASDIAIFGILFLYIDFRKNNIGYPLLPVHDSIDGEHKFEKEYLVKPSCKLNLVSKPKRVLNTKFNLDTTNLYLDVDVKTGLNSWGD